MINSGMIGVLTKLYLKPRRNSLYLSPRNIKFLLCLPLTRCYQAQVTAHPSKKGNPNHRELAAIFYLWRESFVRVLGKGSRQTEAAGS